jgi:hypothetical protein
MLLYLYVVIGLQFRVRKRVEMVGVDTNHVPILRLAIGDFLTRDLKTNSTGCTYVLITPLFTHVYMWPWYQTLGVYFHVYMDAPMHGFVHIGIKLDKIVIMFILKSCA